MIKWKLSKFQQKDFSLLLSLFKGFHCTLISNYNEAKEQYEQAEKLLKYIADTIEHAEFNYRMGNFYYHSYQQINAIDYLKKAKEDFTKQRDMRLIWLYVRMYWGYVV